MNSASIASISGEFSGLVSGHTDRTLAVQYQRYLEEFWKEECDADTALASSQKGGMPRRLKIRAHIGRLFSEVTGSTANASQTAEQFRTVDKAQSGYLHGAAPQLMEMVGGSPPRFHMDGMLGTPTEQVHREQFWYYVSRSICAFALALQAFGDDDGFVKIRAYPVEFERSRPDNGGARESPVRLIRNQLACVHLVSRDDGGRRRILHKKYVGIATIILLNNLTPVGSKNSLRQNSGTYGRSGRC